MAFLTILVLGRPASDPRTSPQVLRLLWELDSPHGESVVSGAEAGRSSPPRSQSTGTLSPQPDDKASRARLATRDRAAVAGTVVGDDLRLVDVDTRTPMP